MRPAGEAPTFDTVPDDRTRTARPAMAGVAMAARARLLDSGDRLGDRYRIARLVGRGGMGDVYEARDEELSIPVAVIVLGFWPQPVLDLAGETGRTLTQTAMPLAGQ